MCCRGKLPELNANYGIREENIMQQDKKLMFIVFVINLQSKWSRKPKGEECLCV